VGDQRKAIVITGASSGIGAKACEELIRNGYTVFGCARREARLQELAEKLNQTEEHFYPFPCDVSEEDQVTRFAEYIRSHTEKVYGLVNCAGAFGEIGTLVETDSQKWWGGIKANLFGTYLMIKHIYPLMNKETGGRIINFSGGGAFGPFPCYSSYAVSKAGIVRLTETLAEELRSENIAVNGIAPGFVKTEIHESTLKLGPETCGEAHYRATKEKMCNQTDGVIPIEIPIECLIYLLSEKSEGLTGRTISAGFDPWREEEFAEKVMEGELYTMRRVNPVKI
jgi:NAD(P)-dependent dehydrogenase (short-subunit alcohol dehydrogenase family)